MDLGFRLQGLGFRNQVRPEEIACAINVTFDLSMGLLEGFWGHIRIGKFGKIV